MFRIPSERSAVATFLLTFFETDSGESIGRKLINARPRVEPSVVGIAECVCWSELNSGAKGTGRKDVFLRSDSVTQLFSCPGDYLRNQNPSIERFADTVDKL